MLYSGVKTPDQDHYYRYLVYGKAAFDVVKLKSENRIYAAVFQIDIPTVMRRSGGAHNIQFKLINLCKVD